MRSQGGGGGCGHLGVGEGGLGGFIHLITTKGFPASYN